MGFHKNFFFSSKEISERSFIAFKAGSSGFYYDFLFFVLLLLFAFGFHRLFFYRFYFLFLFSINEAGQDDQRKTCDRAADRGGDRLRVHSSSFRGTPPFFQSHRSLKKP